jgi:hypothetical protein
LLFLGADLGAAFLGVLAALLDFEFLDIGVVFLVTLGSAIFR